MTATAHPLDTIVDPVCGAPMGADAAFRAANAGQEYCFCSRACLEQFNADPARYCATGAAPDAAAVPNSTSDTVAPPPVPLRDLDDDPQHAFGEEPADWGVEIRGSIALRPGAPTTHLLTPERQTAARPGLLARLLPGKEQRFARRVCRELLALHASIARAFPTLKGRDLYRRIAMERLRTDAKGADALLQKADESFAWWPTTREITFSDVVHMIAILEFHASHKRAHWLIADMGRVVAEEIDHTL